MSVNSLSAKLAKRNMDQSKVDDFGRSDFWMLSKLALVVHGLRIFLIY